MQQVTPADAAANANIVVQAVGQVGQVEQQPMQQAPAEIQPPAQLIEAVPPGAIVEMQQQQQPQEVQQQQLVAQPAETTTTAPPPPMEPVLLIFYISINSCHRSPKSRQWLKQL